MTVGPKADKYALNAAGGSALGHCRAYGKWLLLMNKRMIPVTMAGSAAEIPFSAVRRRPLEVDGEKGVQIAELVRLHSNLGLVQRVLVAELSYYSEGSSLHVNRMK